jgi:ADP-heptose:LPS heptosyltransferase
MLRRNVFIFHAGALGDFVVTWPLAVALGRLYPQNRIIYVTHKQKGDLARDVLRVESSDLDAGWHGLFADGGAPAEAQARTLAGAHSVYTFVSNGSDAWAANVRRLAPEAPLVALAPRPAGAYGGHVTDFLMEQLAPVRVVREAVGQILASIAERSVASNPPAPARVVVHPGSGGRDKCWPAEKYLELIGRLRQGGQAVRVLLGEVESERWSADLIARFEAAADVARPQTYIELLKELRQARAFVGNDSGPAHLAGILGVPTLALFGPSDPTVWRPLGPRVTVLHHSPLDSLQVDEVLAAMPSSEAPRINAGQAEDD